MSFTEDQKQLIDFLTSGYAFSDQEAEEMVELAEIGRLALESRRDWLNDDKTLSESLDSSARMDTACDAFLAKQPKGAA